MYRALQQGEDDILYIYFRMTEIFDNIRSIYHFSVPCEELLPYVEFFSESSAVATYTHTGNTSFTVKMFPSYTPTFWFNLGVAYELGVGKDRYHIPAGRDVLVVRNSTVERFNHPADHLFSVKFFPGALETILGVDQSGMTDRVVDLHEILPATLIRQVKAQRHFEQRMKVLQDFLLMQLQTKKKRDHYLHFVQQTIAEYEAGNLQYNVGEMCAQMFTTSKTISRYFDRVIGVTPKNYFSVVRARTALTAFVANRQLFIPDKFGYYDMSHFYREMVKFTGQRMEK